MLPMKNLLVAIPNDMKATNIRIIDYDEEEISSTFNILPAQSPQKVGVSIKSSSSAITSGFKKYLYSTKRVELNRMTDLAGQGIAIVTVYPFQYNPYLKTLKLLNKIEFEIECEEGYICGDYLPNSITKSEINLYKERVKEMVYNPEKVVVNVKKGNKALGIDPGYYDYVIITKNSWVSSFQTLSDWKTQKGIPANIVTTEWIYNNYSGSSNQSKIRAFIQDAHSNWGTTFFLLGGDTDTIPYYTVNYKGNNIPTDTLYSDYDDDWTCEVNVGRASVTGNGSGAGKIGNFINKTLNYEKNPPIQSYAKNISLFGFDLDYTTEGEDCKIDIESLYIPSNWTVTKVYDSHSGNHEDNVDSAVNSGQNLINHIDHSSYNYMGTGYTNHDWGLDNSEVDVFSNGDKQGVWYSIGCLALAFDYDNCIAEHFVRDTDGGGVGFIGNTRYGWYWVGGDDLASLRYDRYFFRSFFDQNHYKLGDLFSDHKMDAYNSMNADDLNKYIFSELTLLGDPELPIWMDNPTSFEVNHPLEIPTESSSFNVHVEDSEGNNIEDAYVCLWKEDEVYLRNYTDSNGNFTFYPSPSTEGNMSVTVTKQDYIPYEEKAEVIANQPPNQPNTPFPPNESIDVPIDIILSWNCIDPDGDPLTYDVYFGTTSPPPLEISNITNNYHDPGILNYETTYYWMIKAWDDSGDSNESPIWSFTTEDVPINFPPEFSNEIPTNGETNVPISTAIVSVDINDYEGDSFNWTIQTSPNIGSSSGNNDYNGTKTCTLSGLEYNTLYTWYVNATDTGSGKTTSEIYTFVTEEEDNNPPYTPIITGPTFGKTGTKYEYKFVTVDPDNDEIFYYIIWGDGTSDGWLGPYSSGDEIKVSHTWSKTGIYKIQAKAKDTNDLESDYGTLTVIIPRTKASFYSSLFKFLEHFPLLQKILISFLY